LTSDEYFNFLRLLNRIKTDLQGQSLLGDMEECKIGLFNLVLNGAAVPFLHNGTVWSESCEGTAVRIITLTIFKNCSIKEKLSIC